MTEFIPPGTQFHALPSPFPMKRGGALQEARVAYETWGQLNPARDNAVLIVTGLSPDAHAARNDGNSEEGWWEAMLGPGKAIDTDRWFVICVNSLGSCKGSTGPASINPHTGALYQLDFPELSVEDGARAAHAVVQALGINQLACIIGNSMGGMTALAYLLLHPGAARSHINISGSAQALPFSIAIRSLQREAIRLDPAWNHGHYDDEHYPESGMRMARKLGVITYRSALEWDGRFGRVRLESDRPDEEPFGLEFRWRVIWKAMPAGSCAASTPIAICTSVVQWIGSTWPSTPAAMSCKAWPRSGWSGRWRSARSPTSCSRCSSRSRLRKAWPWAARRLSSCRWSRHKATTPSWSTLNALLRPWRAFWRRCKQEVVALFRRPVLRGRVRRS